MVQAQPCQVERLDWEGRKAFVTRTQADYYTDAIDYTKLKMLERFDRARGGEGTCAPRRSARGAARGRLQEDPLLHAREHRLRHRSTCPTRRLHTTAVWWQVDPGALDAAFRQSLAGAGRLPRRGLRAAPRRRARSPCPSAQTWDAPWATRDATWSASVGADGRGAARSFDGQPVDVEHGVSRLPCRPCICTTTTPAASGLSAPLFDLRASGRRAGA